MLLTEQDMQKIFRVPLFHGVQKNAALRIFDTCNCELCDFEKNEIIFSPEQKEKRAGILLSGRAEVRTSDTSTETILRYLSAQDLFGIANFFSDAPYVSRITAKSACHILFLPELAIRQLLENDRAFLYNYLGFLSGRIRFLNLKIGFFTAGTAERKLARYLLSLRQSQVSLDLSMSALSDLLDLGRASLYRAFDRLEEEGCILRKGRKFISVNHEKLKEKYGD